MPEFQAKSIDLQVSADRDRVPEGVKYFYQGLGIQINSVEGLPSDIDWAQEVGIRHPRGLSPFVLTLHVDEKEKFLDVAFAANPEKASDQLFDDRLRAIGGSIDATETTWDDERVLDALKDGPTIAKLWEALGNVPIDDDGDLVEPFMDFDAGTPREDVWHWFEDVCPDFQVYAPGEPAVAQPG